MANLPEGGQRLELDVAREHIAALATHDDVQWIDFWSPPEADMNLVRQDAGMDWVETNFGYCGTGVRGEVLDAGIQQDHPDFDGVLMHTAADVQDHGTSTYGIVLGNGARDGDGSAQALGQLPCAQGIFADYNEMGDRFLHTQALKSAPYFASFQSNSWGTNWTRSYNSYSFEMDDIAWRLDIALVQSQSNEGDQDSRPQAWAKNVISVGAVNHYNTLSTADDCWCTTASIGPAEDGRIKPDLNYWYDNNYTISINSGYTSVFGGTSASTPEVAGRRADRPDVGRQRASTDACVRESSSRLPCFVAPVAGDEGATRYWRRGRRRGATVASKNFAMPSTGTCARSSSALATR